MRAISASTTFIAFSLSAASFRRSRPRTVVLTSFVIALLVLEVMGLCVTYGVPDPVWR